MARFKDEKPVVGHINVEVDFLADGEPLVFKADFAKASGDDSPNDEGIGTDRRGVGPEAVFYAMIEGAIDDCKQLRKAGIIVGIGCVREWPTDSRGKPKECAGHYTKRFQVEQLIDWLTNGDFDHELEMLGSELVNVDDTLRELGLVRKIRGRAA